MDYREFTEKIATGLEIGPSHERQLALAANSAIEDGELMNALQLFEHAANALPNAKTLTNLGVFFLTEGSPQGHRWFLQPTKAIEVLERALQFSPIPAQTYAALGDAYYRVGRVDDAQQAWGRSVGVTPSKYGCNNLGVALYCQERYGDAAKLFWEIHSHWGSECYDFRAYFNYGLSCAMAGQRSCAKRVTETLLYVIEGCDQCEVDIVDISTVLFLCEEYAQVCQLLGDSIRQYVVSPNLFGLYVYALYQAGKESIADAFFISSCQLTSEAVSEISSDLHLEAQYKQEAIAQLTETNRKLQSIYVNIKAGRKPTLISQPYLEYACHMFGCVRHNTPY